MSGFLQSTALLLVLLNPFLCVVYFVDVMRKLDGGRFNSVLVRAGLIAGGVFCAFALLGDVVFTRFLQADFASFQIFGGIVFFLIGLQFVFQGPTAIEMLRGESPHLAGAIAMPILIGPGTISASVVIGERHDPLVACLAVLLAVTAFLVTIALLKALHDIVRPRREPLIERYVEVAGRITALVVGTIAVQMTMQGIRTWAAKF